MKGELEMEKILTISIAAYNVERFLAKTLDSCINVDSEVIGRLEIFIVDDGSTDKTKEIGMRYQNDYPDSIIYVSKENGGHGSTVNYSMKHASGKYFMLLDGDDWVDSSQFETLVKLLETETADIVSCCYNMVDNSSLEFVTINPNNTLKTNYIYSAKDVLNSAKIYLAGLIIKTEIIQSHPFLLQEKCFYVDMEYVTFPIPYVNTVIFYNLIVYQCRTALANQSTSRLGTVKHADDHIKVAKSLLRFYNEQKKKGIDDFRLTYIRNMCQKTVEDVFLMPFSFPVTDKEIRNKILEFNSFLRENNTELYYARYRRKVNIMRAVDYFGWQMLSIMDKIME